MQIRGVWVQDDTVDQDPATQLVFPPGSLTDLGHGKVGVVAAVGSSILVTDGVTSVVADTIDFTSGATVTDGGGGTAEVAVNGGSQPIDSPLDIAGCELWLDASQLALADDAAVTTWPDLSGNGYDATQATAENKPICKTAVLNGLRVVRFAGSPDAQTLALSGDALDLFRNIDACTIACVVGNPTQGNTMPVLTASENGDATLRRVGIEYHGDGVLNVSGCNDGSGSDAEQFQVQPAPGGVVAFLGAIDWSLHAITFEASVGFKVNDQPAFADSVGPTPNSASDAIVLGAFGFEVSDCDYAEIVVYQRGLNLSERRQLLEYLSAKWATL